MTDETMSRTHVEEEERQTPELQQSEQLEPSQQQNPDQADKQEPQQEDELADERPDEVITQKQQSEGNSNDRIPVGHLDDSDNAMALEAEETVEGPIEAQTQALESTEKQSTDDQEMDVEDQSTDIVDQATDVVDHVMDDDSNKEADVIDPEELERVQQQRRRELEKLRAIDAKVRQMHERLSSRLPRQRTHLVAKVCGSVWAAKAQKARLDNADAFAKKLRLELGAFDYQVREQGELLTRHLCELDDVLSFGDAEIKDARKALVVFIQSEELPLADALRVQSSKLRAFGERLVASVATAASTEVSSEDTSVSSTEASSSVEQSSNQNNDNGDNGDNDDEMVDSDANDEDQDGDGNDGNDADPNDVMDDSAAEDQSDESRDTTDPRRLASLPVWKPYYQIQQRRGALYLIANLRDVEPQNLRVQWLERTGVLHISGVKLPTRRDVMVSRFSGVPTFGRFEITERVPASVGVDMVRASQTLDEDGTLEVRMPYAAPSRSVGVGDILDGMRFVRPRNDISNNHSNEYPNYYSNVAGRPSSYYEHSQQPAFYQSYQPQPRRESYYNYQHPYQQELRQSLYPLQRDYYHQQQQQHQGFPHSAFRRRGSPWFDAPRCMVW